MKVTNKFNLPEAFIRVVSEDNYTKGEADITASEIGLPPRIFALKRQHEHELEVDASELVKIMMGKAIHQVLEDANKDALVEERIYTRVLDWNVGGKFDRVSVFDAVLTDWKTSTVDAFRAKWREGFREWTIQLNIYVYLLRKNGYQVEKARVILFLLDHSPSKARREEEYPQLAVQVLDFEIWPEEVTERFLNAQVQLFQSALMRLPLCSDEDRWMRGGQTAVKKEGRVRAVKLFASPAEAEEWLKRQSDAANLYLETRPKEFIRCLDFCPVRKFCKQWRDGIEEDKAA